MKGSIFDYQDYKIYLKEWLASQPRHGRGEKRRMAEALRCHTAYITRVFRGSAHLSLEQASDLSVFLGLRFDEQHFFLLLVQHARAGNNTLKNYLEREMRKVIEARLQLKNRIQFKRKLSNEDQSIYYSSWHYSAVFALVSISSFQTEDAITNFFRLPRTKISETLEFLVSKGLLTFNEGRYQIGTTSIHLGNDSPMISKHHTNWRIQAIRSLERSKNTDLHYSSVVSLAKKDIANVRAILIKTIEEIRGIVTKSPEEVVYAYALDLFDLAE